VFAILILVGGIVLAKSKPVGHTVELVALTDPGDGYTPGPWVGKIMVWHDDTRDNTCYIVRISRNDVRGISCVPDAQTSEKTEE